MFRVIKFCTDASPSISLSNRIVVMFKISQMVWIIITNDTERNFVSAKLCNMTNASYNNLNVTPFRVRDTSQAHWEYLELITVGNVLSLGCWGVGQLGQISHRKPDAIFFCCTKFKLAPAKSGTKRLHVPIVLKPLNCKSFLCCRKNSLKISTLEIRFYNILCQERTPTFCFLEELKNAGNVLYFTCKGRLSKI